MKKRLEEKRIYIAYSILFAIIVMLVFAIFFKNNCSFIWEGDGLKQHYIILKDFNESIRSFFANPKEGIDLFSWNMGLGMDVIGQYSYYILGDPFAYLSLLFPMQYLEFSYTFLIILRMFCIGLSFIFYANYHKRRKQEQSQKGNFNYSILLGAIIYTFCSFTLFAGVRHPYFLNAMILFPLLLTSIDKLLDEDKKAPLVVTVAISAISNYYFFYMHTIMLIIYAIIRYVCEYRKEGIKHFFKKLSKAIICYIIGVLIACFILLPTAYAFLNSARSGEETICKYGLDYYKSLFSINLLTSYGLNWSYIGVSSIILLMLPIIWLRRKEHKVYFSYLIVGTVILLIPFLGSVMNGFSFPNNRWSFMYAFIMSYIITLCLDKEYTKKELVIMAIFLAFYSVVSIIAVLFMKSMSCFVIYLIQIILAFLMLIMITFQSLFKNDNKSNVFNKINFGTISVFVLVITNIFVMAYGLYSSYDRNYAKQFVKAQNCKEELDTQLGKNLNYGKSIENIKQKDNGFYRIAKLPHLVQNLSIYYGYASTECFLSLGNKYVYNLNKELSDNSYSTTSSIRGIGDRTKITTLLSTKYYIADEKNKSNVPYGYSLKEDNNGVLTYENNYSLPIGIAYTEYMLKDEYEKLNPLEKEDLLMNTAVIENEEKLQGITLSKKENIENIKSSYIEVPYEIKDDNKILENNKIVTKKKNQKIVLDFEKVDNSELYVYISGFEFQGNSKHVVTASLNEKNVSKTIENKITSAYYQKAPEILLNLGYYENTKGEIELKFSAKGIYNFDKIGVLAVPMKNYEEEVQKLQKNKLNEIIVTSNEIKGKITLEKDAILQIATSYTDGWKAYVDGIKVDTINVNTAFIGVPVKKSQHEIYLKYEVPYLKLGISCSILGIIGFVIILIIDKRKK